MLELDNLTQRKRPSMLNTMQRRLPKVLQTVGPEAPNKPMVRKIFLWDGVVKGDFTGGSEDEARNAYLEFTDPQGNVKIFSRFTSPAVRDRFALTFDVNGRETIVWQEGNTCYIHFYDDSKGEWVDLPVEEGARSPVTALDSLYPEKLERDVVVSYLLGNKLMVRYQRERYAVAHEIQGIDLPDGIMLRCCGFTTEWRFAWRFEEHLVRDSYTKPEVNAS